MPDTVLPGLVPPSNTIFCRLTPCGQFLVAFNVVQNELVVYRYRGVELGLREAAAAGTAAAERPAGGASQRRQQPPPPPRQQHDEQEQQQPRPAVPQQHPSGSSGVVSGGQQQPSMSGQSSVQQAAAGSSGSVAGTGAAAVPRPQPGQPLPAQRVHDAAPPPPAAAAAALARVSFADVFVEQWRCSPAAASSEEQLVPDFCLVAHSRLLLVASAPRETQLMDADGLLPICDSITFHLVTLETGQVEDRCGGWWLEAQAARWGRWRTGAGGGGWGHRL